MSQFIDLNVNQFGSNANNNINTNMNPSKPLTHQSYQSQQRQQSLQSLHSPQTQTQDEECDDRKKYEKFRLYKSQQKRLQEMSFTKDLTKSSADHLIHNIIQKVDSEAKLDKRINASNKQTVVNPVFNSSGVSSISASVLSPINPNLSAYYSQYCNTNTTHNNVQQNMRQFVSTQPMMASISHTQQQYSNTYRNSSQSYPQTLSLNTTPIHSETSSEQNYINYESMDGFNRTEKACPDSYIPNNTQNTSMTSMTSAIYNLNSDAIESAVSLNASQQSIIVPKNSINSVTNNEIDSSLNSPQKRKIPLCFSDISKMPSIYLKVWNYVQINEMSSLCDTNKLYAVLLSGGLPQTLLAQLWTYVNNTIPGQLTRHELHMALALIALIQKNSPNPIEEVYRLHSLPIPILQLFPNSQTEKLEPKEQSKAVYKTEPQMIINMKNDNILTEMEPISDDYNIDVNDNEFADFKSADYSSAQDVKPSEDHLLDSCSHPLNDVNDDEFDDFKYATTDQSKALPEMSNIETKSENQNLNKRANSLTEALFSNISAIGSLNNNDNNNCTNSSTIVNNSISVINSNNFCEKQFESNSNFCENKGTSGTTEPNGNSVDKYSVFRELLTEESLTKSEDFGDFLSHATNFDAESVDSLQFGHQDSDNDNTSESIKHQIMQTCRQLIHKAFNVLVVNHGEESVTQAMNTTEGKGFALDLLEVYGISRRVWTHSKANDKTNDNFVKLMSDIENTWNAINSVFTKASLELDLNEENKSEKPISSQCAICCSKFASEESLLTFASFQYHSSCANLWLNCINATLPQPILNCR